MKGEAMNFYTSYETSLALRDAGAEQGEGDTAHWRVGDFPPILAAYRFWPPDIRAFRADEIIEALGDRLSSILQPSPGTWKVTVFNPNDFHRSRATSLVEALAQAWLAVLKEGK